VAKLLPESEWWYVTIRYSAATRDEVVEERDPERTFGDGQRDHLAIRCEAGRYVVVDLDGEWPVRVSGRPIPTGASEQLRAGDVIEASTLLRVVFHGTQMPATALEHGLLPRDQTGYLEVVASEDDELVGTTVPIRNATFWIGCAYVCQLVIRSRGPTAISRVNTVITYDAGTFWVTDRDSTNGTRVAGQLLATARPLAPGDLIDVGGILGEDGVLRRHTRLAFLGQR
jgi:pSer/pThr/pTyr-binding forkhead associated (FHA) protein